MRFVVIPNTGSVPQEAVDVGYLWSDNWNDWFKYKTLYNLTYFDDKGEKHDLGYVKIGQFDMTLEQKRPDLPVTFEELDERFFSLGQDADYYSSVMGLEEETSIALLLALNDIAANEDLYHKALEEAVTGESLLRFVNMKTIEGQYRRILQGDAVLTDYNFHYVGPLPEIEGVAPLNFKFEVEPDSRPPSNIHVLIGRNGVGKTFVLNAMTRALVLPNSDANNDGHFTSFCKFGVESTDSPFSNILSVTFSAFDDFEIVRQRRNATKGVRYVNVGLRRRVKNNKNELVTITRDPADLAEEFSSSAKFCIRGAKAKRWRKALSTLEADPIFEEAEVARLANIDDDSFGREASKLYRQLSSGHKIVLLTITKLVENVEEKTLVLIDEPEAHLHPPLLAAFIRALSDLLISRNGVAIIATHSPVVLQEVPLSCVWKIIRHGLASKATRPKIETFAENVGVLTREVFGLEVMRSGFHKLLAEVAENADTIEEVVEQFDFEVGSEGRALISSMIATRE